MYSDLLYQEYSNYIIFMGKIQDIGDRVNILMLIHFEHFAHFDQNQSKPLRLGFG